ncbi:hypothetical protein RJT34_07088 [Clitoria ternatea]|uniref:Uncharacterized protein n=1 Tax=Clitoria ternatea TaxID=43366 RepID=A0AAN9K2A9_CLITE
MNDLSLSHRRQVTQLPSFSFIPAAPSLRFHFSFNSHKSKLELLLSSSRFVWQPWLLGGMLQLLKFKSVGDYFPCVGSPGYRWGFEFLQFQGLFRSHCEYWAAL